MRYILLILIIFSVALKAQDKLFFLNGTVKKGIIVSIAKDVVYFKSSDTSEIQKINRADLVMSENYKGVRFIFFSQPSKKDTGAVPVKIRVKQNYLGVQPAALLVGRVSLVYERLSDNGKTGLVIPLSLTFNPFGTLYGSQFDPNQGRSGGGINFIGGADVNFYAGKNPGRTFFLGPRLRYGTDLLLGGVEAATLQTQIGWRFGDESQPVRQHLSLGFGFVNVITSSPGLTFPKKQFLPWFSINYRVGISW